MNKLSLFLLIMIIKESEYQWTRPAHRPKIKVDVNNIIKLEAQNDSFSSDAANLYCRKVPQSTACFLGCIFNKNCGPNPLLHRFTTPQLGLILARHNELRDRLAAGSEYERYGVPSASNMMVLQRSMEAEHLAGCWARQCSSEADKSAYTLLGDKLNQLVAFYPYVPNISIERNIMKFIDGWYNQVNNITRRILDNYSDGKGWSDFTQLIWARSTHVGCAFLTFTPLKPPILFSRYKKFTGFYCNYWKAGNIEGERIYKFGEPGDNCPNNVLNNRYSSLCGIHNFATSPISINVYQFLPITTLVVELILYII